VPAGINRAGSRGGNASVMVAAESFERVSALVDFPHSHWRLRGFGDNVVGDDADGRPSSPCKRLVGRWWTLYLPISLIGRAGSKRSTLGARSRTRTANRYRLLSYPDQRSAVRTLRNPC
jgi:hypothetical protein